MKDRLLEKSREYIDFLCSRLPGRCVGSEGNRQAAYFVEKEFSFHGWKTEMPGFDAMDWEDEGATLECEGKNFSVLVSPYSLGFRGEAQLVSASTIIELESTNAGNKILFLHGELAREQLMPKNFVFYNPDHHRKFIALLEMSGAAAIIAATGRNPAVSGGVYPFPLIEDGDFNIPSVYMTEEEGEKLKPFTGKTVFLESRSERIPGKGFNVIAGKGNANSGRIVITAHIDAKNGTPGALDNATGVAVLMLLADMLKDYSGNKMIELVAFNGEDYYAVPGQMNYISANRENFKSFLLNVNIDGAGFREGASAFSLFDLPAATDKIAHDLIHSYPGIEEGPRWPQGDHSIFLQFGIPAIAVSSKWLIDNMTDQDITHTPKDKPEIVDCGKLVEIARAIDELVRRI